MQSLKSSFKLLNKTLQKRSFASSTQETIQPKSSILGKKLFIWGKVEGSSLGLGNEDRDSSIPIQLDDIDGSGYRDISLGTTHCGIVTGKGDVYMFGISNYGELGLGEDISSSILNRFGSNKIKYDHPTKIESLSNITAISCGGRHTCCIDENGLLYSWGWGGNRLFSCGGLGHGNKDSLNEPKLNEYLSSQNEYITDVSCGDKHSLCINSSGEIYAFGEGEHGRLGTGHTSSCKIPTKLSFFGNIEIARVYAAKEYSFGLTSDGGILYGWGRNDRGQMGQGGGLAMDMYSCDTIPISIAPPVTNIINVGLSQGDVLCVDINGNCYYWGERVFLEPHYINNERFDQDGGDSLPNGSQIQSVDISGSIMCFLTNNGELFTCNKTFGMKSDIFPLGQGSVKPNKNAKRVNSLKDYKINKVIANDHRVIAIAD